MVLYTMINSIGLVILNITILIIINAGWITGQEGPRVIGGSSAGPDQFPYQVSIRKPDTHICGGSILNEFWVLTAAHCVVGDLTIFGRTFLFGNPPIVFTILVGTTKLNKYDALNVHAVMYVKYHERYYQDGKYSNDIAVLRVAVGFDLKNPFIGAIQLAKLIPPVGSTAILSGWGQTTNPGGTPNDLQYIFLNIISLESCKASWGSSIINVGHICTKMPAGKGACMGDSGGPLVYRRESTSTSWESCWVQVGVVSFGKPCAKGAPDVFTNVLHFKPWIEAVIQTFKIA